MNCNYDCDESPPLSSNDSLMKNVTVLICSGVDGLSIFASFSQTFNRNRQKSQNTKGPKTMCDLQCLGR
jgi:hypothetical protein